MRTVHFATLRVFPVVIAVACGGRTALDDEVGFGPDDDGMDASGGRNSGGRSPGPTGGRPNRPAGGAGFGGRFSTGGTFPTTGGAFPTTGGASPTGGNQGCIYGAWGDGDNCQDWTTCEPGEYVAGQGTSTSDRFCAPCPPNTFTADENRSECAYSGCEFGSLTINPGTSTSHADCAPDPDYAHLGSTYGTYLMGLVARGDRAYVGVVQSLETTLRGYQRDMPVDTLSFRPAFYDAPWTFAFAPDGTIYLAGRDYSNGLSWIESHSSDLTISERMSLGPSAYSSYSFGLTSTSTDWIHHQLTYGPDTSKLVLSVSPHPELAPTETEVALEIVISVSAADKAAIWIVGYDDGIGLFRLDALTPPLTRIELPEGFVPETVAAASTGFAYVLGTSVFDYRLIQVAEVDPSGVVTRSWTLAPKETEYFSSSVIAVDPGRAVFVACDVGYYQGSQYPNSGTDVRVVRLDLITNESTILSFVGPGGDWVNSAAVTADGAAYIAGGSDGSYYVRRVF